MTSRLITVFMLSAHVVPLRAAQLECDNGCKVGGTKYNLTCTSTSAGGCDWYRGATSLVSCAPGGTCISHKSGYIGFKISDTHYVLQIESLTAETLECRLGLDTAQSCAIAPVTDVPTGTLTIACYSDLIKCSGIDNHGTPAAAIELRKGSTVLTSTTTGGSVSITQANSAGVTYTCAVTGDLANCLSITSVIVKCSDDVCPIIILVLTVISQPLVVILLLVTYYVKKEWFQYAAIGFGACDAVVGIISTAVYFDVCQSDTPLGTSAAAFSIIGFIVGTILIVIGVLYRKSSEKPEEKPREQPEEKPREQPEEKPMKMPNKPSRM